MKHRISQTLTAAGEEYVAGSTGDTFDDACQGFERASGVVFAPSDILKLGLHGHLIMEGREVTYTTEDD